MRHYKKILVWENSRRLENLYMLRELVLQYFNNSRAELMMGARIEEQAASEARVKINRIIDEAHDIILYADINPSITWSPPPAVGGYIRNIDLIQNIFNLEQFQITGNEVLDFIDRTIGIYEANNRSAALRVINPFFYLALLFDTISELPFFAIEKLGFNRKKAESSSIGKLVKGVLYLITVAAGFLTILELLGFIEPVKAYVHEAFGSNK